MNSSKSKPKTHIPRSRQLTYCGRPRARVACINLRTMYIEDATCQACQRSDDRRTREAYLDSLETPRDPSHSVERKAITRPIPYGVIEIANQILSALAYVAGLEKGLKALSDPRTVEAIRAALGGYVPSEDEARRALSGKTETSKP